MSHNPASAQTNGANIITVNTAEDESTDDGDCSLREAIEAANGIVAVDGCKAGSDTQRDAIHFALGEEVTIVLGSALPAIGDASGLNINGLRADITISGNDAVQVFQVNSRAKLTLAKLTVADGSPSGLSNVLGTVKVTNSSQETAPTSAAASTTMAGRPFATRSWPTALRAGIASEARSPTGATT